MITPLFLGWLTRAPRSRCLALAWHLALTLAAVIFPLTAQSRTIAGWDLTYNDRGCEIHGEYDLKGGTDVSLNLDIDGSADLLVGNKNWSIGEGDAVDLDFLVNGKSYRGKAIGVSGRFDATKMFGTILPAEFIADFATSPYLIVMKGTVTVTRVSLSGSAEAIKAAHLCLETVRARVAAVEAKKRRDSDIADDPFAKPGTAPEGVAVKGGPKGNPLGWFTDDDYPADAKRAGAQGSVSVLLSIDTSGKVAGCRVTASSGNGPLDEETCRLAERRGRFTVQKGSDGNAQPYSFALPGIRWSLKAE